MSSHTAGHVNGCYMAKCKSQSKRTMDVMITASVSLRSRNSPVDGKSVAPKGVEWYWRQVNGNFRAYQRCGVVWRQGSDYVKLVSC